MTYSFPCQDLSLAGKGKGMSKDSGTRSGLLWEVERILNECGKNLPQILVMENVPQVIGQKNIKDFQEWELFLERKGYSNYIKILNAKNYGIPQNRQRCFMVSILGNAYYEFPKKIKLKTKLKDLLEDQVDEKYFLSKAMTEYVLATNDYQKDIALDNEIARTINTTPTSHRSMVDNYLTEEYTKTGERISKEELLKIKNATKKGYTEAKDGDGIDISTRMETHRGTVQKDMIQTIKAQLDVEVVVKENLKEKLCNKLLEDGIVEDGDIIKHSYTQQILDGNKKCVEKSDGTMITLTTRPDCVGIATKTISNLRIRKITPKEAWRLMGFTSEDFDKASKVNSNAQLYKQAGNSIVVQVLMGIFGKLCGMSNNEIETKIRKSIEEIK